MIPGLLVIVPSGQKKIWDRKSVFVGPGTEECQLSQIVKCCISDTIRTRFMTDLMKREFRGESIMATCRSH